MFKTEEKIRKNIITSDGEDEFQIRYLSDENVGILTTRLEKSYFILDSAEYWYDMIQERYPAKKKCSCKNDYFKVYFDYIPRIGTDDYRKVEITFCCTKCFKETFAHIDIDYSPTIQLFEEPITYCEKPKIKYQIHSLRGYFEDQAFYDLLDFLSQKHLLIYCWYWSLKENKRCVKKLSIEDFKPFLMAQNMKFLSLYFSAESLDSLFDSLPKNEDGIYVDYDIWRKKEVIQINCPIMCVKLFYSIDFCSEYIENGEVKRKSASFCALAHDVLEYGRKNLVSKVK